MTFVALASAAGLILIFFLKKLKEAGICRCEA